MKFIFVFRRVKLKGKFINEKKREKKFLNILKEDQFGLEQVKGSMLTRVKHYPPTLPSTMVDEKSLRIS